MTRKPEKKSVLKSIVKNMIALLIFFGVLFFLYRSCTSGYEKYAFYVHADDVAVFEAPLNQSDTRIINRGRTLTHRVLVMDQDIDSGDGANAGKLRWYVCGGIDCEEGWETSLLAEK